MSGGIDGCDERSEIRGSAQTLTTTPKERVCSHLYPKFSGGQTLAPGRFGACGLDIGAEVDVGAEGRVQGMGSSVWPLCKIGSVRQTNTDRCLGCHSRHGRYNVARLERLGGAALYRRGCPMGRSSCNESCNGMPLTAHSARYTQAYRFVTSPNIGLRNSILPEGMV
jgi:hypothetical protein